VHIRSLKASAQTCEVQTVRLTLTSLAWLAVMLAAQRHSRLQMHSSRAQISAISFLLVLLIQVLACRADWAKVPEYFKEMGDGDLVSNVTCKNEAGAVVPCQNLYLFGSIWQTAGPSIAAWPIFMCFERMRMLINHEQKMLPGYNIIVDWFNDNWDMYEVRPPPS
jgi:hypothetical protein